MRQQINLVNPALLPPKPFFQFKSMMISLAIIVGFLGGLVLLFKWGAEVNQVSSALIERKLVARQESIKKLEEQVAQKKTNTGLEAQVKALQTEQERLKKMELMLRQGGMAEEVRSQADVLYALAHRPAKGVWLTQVELHGNQVSLEGNAAGASVIPAYLSQVMSLPEFKGQRFERFELGSLRPQGGLAEAEAVSSAYLRQLMSLPEFKEMNVELGVLKSLAGQGGAGKALTFRLESVKAGKDKP